MSTAERCPHCRSADRGIREFVKVPETRGRMRCPNPWHQDEPSPARQQMAADLRKGKITLTEAQQMIMDEILGQVERGKIARLMAERDDGRF